MVRSVIKKERRNAHLDKMAREGRTLKAFKTGDLTERVSHGSFSGKSVPGGGKSPIPKPREGPVLGTFKTVMPLTG